MLNCVIHVSGVLEVMHIFELENHLFFQKTCIYNLLMFR